MTRKIPLPSLAHLTCVISHIVMMRQYDITIALLRRVELLAMLHDDCSLTILMNCYGQLKHVGLAFSLLGKLWKLGCSRDCFVFDTLINGLVGADQLDQALTLLEFSSKASNLTQLHMVLWSNAYAEKQKTLLLSSCLWKRNPTAFVSLILWYTAQSLTAFVKTSYLMRPLTSFPWWKAGHVT